MSIASIVSRLATKLAGVFEAGKKKEWSEFWDEYQQNGTRTQYGYAFSAYAWTDKNFRPKYDIKTEYMNSIFTTCSIVDIESCLKQAGVDGKGVTLDYSLTQSPATILSYNSIVQIFPELNLSNATGMKSTFNNATSLKVIRKLILNDSGQQTFTTPFANCLRLEEIRIEGVIGQDIPFTQSSKLTVDSMKSIILHLKNYKGTEEEALHSVTFHADALARLEAEGATSPNNNLWTEYINDLGWQY